MMDDRQTSARFSEVVGRGCAQQEVGDRGERRKIERNSLQDESSFLCCKKKQLMLEQC